MNDKCEGIHNESVHTFFKMNGQNRKVKLALQELDKSVKGSYMDYLEENIGDDAILTLQDLSKIMRGKLYLKCLENGTIEFKEIV